MEKSHVPMNDSTLPPSQRLKKPLPKRVNPRARMGVKKGFGLHDWNRLLKHAKDPAQRRGAPLRSITTSELKLHKTEHDGWTALHGKVYNITPYLHYHPGGVDILKHCLGKDGTKLFEKYHTWVNINGLIGPLLIGYLEEDKKSTIYEDNAPSSPVLPPSLLQSTSSCSMSSSSSVSSTEEEAKLEFSSPSPRPKPNRALSDLLPPAKDGEEEEDDLNPWEK